MLGPRRIWQTIMRTVKDSSFERAYSLYLQNKGRRPASRPSSQAREVPLFYVALGISVAIYLGFLALGPATLTSTDWFRVIGDPERHPELAEFARTGRRPGNQFAALTVDARP